MKFFSVDGALYRFMTGVKDLFLLNLCWLIGSIPVLTIGLSTVAAFDVALRMADNEEGYVMRQFFRAYKANIKQGIPLGVITLLCAYVLYLELQLVNALPEGSVALLIVTVLSAFLFIFTLLYAFALTARYVNTLPKILRNSFRISMKYFPRSIFTVFIAAFELAVICWNYTTLFLGALIGPAFVIYSVAVMEKPLFKRIEKENNE